MSKIAYVNGAYLPQRQASVNIEDRGYQFGDGIYEVVHLFDGRYIDEDLHLDRLERSLREISLPMPMSRAALRLVLREVARRNRVTEGLLYMQVTRFGGNISRTANFVGMERSALHRKLKVLGVHGVDRDRGPSLDS